MQVFSLAPDDPRWMAVLADAPHDFYQLPGYVTLAGRVDQGEPVAILVEDGPRRLLMPLLLRDLPPDLRGGAGRGDATSPYGYPGIAIASSDPVRPADAGFARAALHAAIGWLLDAGVVSLFLRMNPILPVDEAILADAGIVVSHGRTVSVDLRKDEVDLFPTLRSNHRRNIARLERLGFTYGIDPNWNRESVMAFLGVYTETMDRLGAATSYYIDERYVDELYAALDGRVSIMLVRLGDEIAAAGLFTEVAGIVQYHLGGTRTAFLPLSPNKGIFTHVAVWARSRGNRILHLGGGLGGAEDALFDFKAGFSPERHVFRTVRVVVDAPAYEALLAERAAVAGQPFPDARGFFPGYRAPLPLTLP